MKQLFSLLIISTIFCLNNTALADDSILPTLIPWQGKSEALIHDDTDPWQTPAEKMGLNDTPSYQETFAYLGKLVQADKRLTMHSIGKSPQQRDLFLVVASKEGATTPEHLLANNKPTLFIQAGIHAGEIDGKDAGLMLVRDIVKGNKGHLLDKVNLLFLPIFNVDGHERRSEFNRVNQRGPKSMGWRTTAQNLNLNRDYAKADAPEMQLLMTTINEWQPSLYLDIHVTDGEDYQYDLTYGFNGNFADSTNISNWLSNIFSPQINDSLKEQGHSANPLVFGLDKMAFDKGLFGWTAGVRFSNGWGDIRHLPTVLVENHSLKPYKQRVLATYVFLETSIEILAAHHDKLTKAIKIDKQSRPKQLTLAWTLDTDNPTVADFDGIEYSTAVDEITGIEYVSWLGKPKIYKDYPTFWAKKAKIKVDVPKAFYVPSQYLDVIKRLKLHGIKLEQLDKPLEKTVAQFIASSPKFGTAPFEGHLTVLADLNPIKKDITLEKNTIKVSTDQPLGRLAVALLDPRGPDSFFAWGFFNQMFQRTEYIENYVMIPLAIKMLNDSPALRKEFEQHFSVSIDPAKESAKKKPGSLNELFSGKPDEKMQWLYRHSKFHDNQYLKYPVLIEY